MTQIVFNSGIPLVMIGLDVTNQAVMTPERIDTLRSRASKLYAAADMKRSYGAGDPCLPDPCVIAYILDPMLFDGVDARLDVECESNYNRSRTVAATPGHHAANDVANCHVITSVDDDRLFAILSDRIARL